MESPRMQEIRKMLVSEPDDAFLNYALALELEKAGDVGKAIDVLEDILLREENYSGAYYKLGGLLEATHQTEKAIAVYRKGIEITTRQKNLKALAEIREAIQNLEEAED